jgi:hypothetical protein
MFSTILFNYASFMKNIEIKSIQYGAFEKLGPSFKVKETIPLENRIAPVLNLTEMIRLQQYTDIASSFVTFGRVRKLSDTLNSENIETNSVVRDVYNALESFDNALLTNRISEIEAGKYMIAIKNSLKPIARKEDIPTPIKDIIRRLHNELNRFGFLPEKSYKNIEAAISWAKHFKMLPQAYTMGQEYIITLVVSLFEEHSPFTKDKDGKKDFRMFMSSICSIGDDDVKTKNYKGLLNQYPDVADKLLKESLINELRPNFRVLGERRNAVNHGKGNVEYDTLVAEFNEFYNKCLNVTKPIYHANQPY